MNFHVRRSFCLFLPLKNNNNNKDYKKKTYWDICSRGISYLDKTKAGRGLAHTEIRVCVCVCVKDSTLTDLGRQVLQEGVVQQLGKVVQDEGKARFGVVLTHHVFQLLPVGLAASVVLHSQTTHLETSKSSWCASSRLCGRGSRGVQHSPGRCCRRGH